MEDSSDLAQRLSGEVGEKTLCDDSSPSAIKGHGTKTDGKGQLSGNDNTNCSQEKNYKNEKLVDEIINLALHGDDAEEEEFLSASDGGESDDEIIQEWGDSLSDLAGADCDTCATTQPDSAAVKDSKTADGDVEAAMAAPSSSVADTKTCNGDHVSDAKPKDKDADEQEPAAEAGVGDEGKGGDGHSDVELDDKKSAEDKEKEELQKRQEMEDALSEEELQSRLADAVEVKISGNNLFKEGKFAEAMEQYTESLKLCPLKYIQQRSIMLSNRAACLMKDEQYEEAVKDCSEAIELQPTYIKAINRRANAYEKLEKLEEALKDHQKILELDRTQVDSYHTAMRLENEIKERNEKMKDEMMGKLKDLGNMVLRPFGLSTNNFQLQQDPSSGSYSVQFVQSPPDNGQ